MVYIYIYIFKQKKSAKNCVMKFKKKDKKHSVLSRYFDVDVFLK